MTVSARLVRAVQEPGLRFVDWRHPEWWVVPIIGAAWLVLVATTLVRLASGGRAAHSGYASIFVCPIVELPGPSLPDVGVIAGAWWAPAMVVAMMGPLVLPALHHVGLGGVWARRRRGPALVLAGFVGTWMPIVWAIDLAVGLAAATAGALAAVVLTVGAASAWQLSTWRVRAVRGCSRTVPLAPRGRRADVDCLRYGALLGRSCVLTCVGYMAVLAAAGHGLITMGVLAAVQLHERSVPGRRPRLVPGLVVLLTVGALAAVQTSA